MAAAGNFGWFGAALIFLAVAHPVFGWWQLDSASESLLTSHYAWQPPINKCVFNSFLKL